MCVDMSNFLYQRAPVGRSPRLCSCNKLVQDYRLIEEGGEKLNPEHVQFFRPSCLSSQLPPEEVANCDQCK